MNKAGKYAWGREILWLGLTLVMVAIWNVLFIGQVNTWIHVFYSYNILISMVYGWWFVQVHESPSMRSFWAKLPVIVVNIPLFFFLMTQTGFFTNLFDAHQYIPEGSTERFIAEDVSLDRILFLRHSGVFWGVAAMVTSVLVALRFIWVIFTHRQIPTGRLYKY